jgi:hypothetical protein
VAFRETYAYKSIDHVVANMGPFRRAHLSLADQIFIVRDLFCMWFLIPGRENPQGMHRPIHQKVTWLDARPKEGATFYGGKEMKTTILAGHAKDRKSLHAQPVVQKEFVIQTTAFAPTTMFGDKKVHDPRIAFFNGTLGNTAVREYVVPESSPWLAALANTPHSKQPVDHITGEDSRPTVSVKFPRSVSLLQAHNLLLKSQLEGRVTRWGKILCPTLTPEAERLFVAAGAEIPRMRQEKLAAKRKAEKEANAEAAAKQKAEREAQRRKEMEEMPVKIWLTKERGVCSHAECGHVQQLLLDVAKIKTKLLSVDLRHACLAISTADGLRIDGTFLQVDGVRWWAQIDPSIFVVEAPVSQRDGGGGGGGGVDDDEGGAVADGGESAPSTSDAAVANVEASNV